MEEGKGMRDPEERVAVEGWPEGAPESRPGPGWRGWVLSILVAVILSVTATLLLGGSLVGRLTPPAAPEATAGGCGGPCCPPAAPER